MKRLCLTSRLKRQILDSKTELHLYAKNTKHSLQGLCFKFSKNFAVYGNHIEKIKSYSLNLSLK